MGTWIVVVALVPLVSVLLPWWAKYQARVNLLSLPLYPSAYVETDPGTIPATVRDGLNSVFAELTPLGFELLGYISGPVFPGAPPRVLGVLRNLTEGAVATVGFALGAMKGAVIDFESLFEDGSWVRTVNRRGHYSPARYRQGRIEDALAATVADQWQAHQRAVAAAPTRPPRVVELAAVARHRNAVDAEEYELCVQDGSRQSASDGISFRFTREGATQFVSKVQAGIRRLTRLPPMTGALAMRLPVDELERRYQDVVYILSQRPKPRAWRTFFISALAFGASSVLLPQWRWLLWAIPFLLLHELGHFATMRLFGHRDATIRFIPFFGAATLTTTRFRKLSHEMVVLLAGPLPGIVIGFLIFQLADFGRSSYAIGSAITLITLNGLNLLPVHPLDGGRIVHALLTAGRPRLDLVLKSLAGAAFLVAALVLKDFTLGILGVAALLFLRSGTRHMRVEKAIRARPGFSPTLTPQERRRCIFEGQSGQEPADGMTWVRGVQQLEVSLAHDPPSALTVLPWLVVYLGCLGGLVAWSVSVFAVSPKVGGHCPTRAQARPLACGSDEAIDWRHVEPGSITHNPFKLRSSSAYPFAAFVWCTGTPATAERVAHELGDVHAAEEFCPALPWEALPSETKAEHDKARQTLRIIKLSRWRETRERSLAWLDQLPASLRGGAMFDEETLRLYRAVLEHGSREDDKRALSQRLGPSPTASCERLHVLSVARNVDRRDDEADDDDDAEEGGDGGATDSGAADRSVAARPAPPSTVSTRVSVVMSAPTEMAAIRKYLCDSGCEVAVMPYGSMDPRLRICF